jgi:hypothetical protein
VWTGHCLKFDQPTEAYPKRWTGRPCFEHRRLSRPATNQPPSYSGAVASVPDGDQSK